MTAFDITVCQDADLKVLIVDVATVMGKRAL